MLCCKRCADQNCLVSLYFPVLFCPQTDTRRIFGNQTFSSTFVQHLKQGSCLYTIDTETVTPSKSFRSSRSFKSRKSKNPTTPLVLAHQTTIWHKRKEINVNGVKAALFSQGTAWVLALVPRISSLEVSESLPFYKEKLRSTRPQHEVRWQLQLYLPSVFSLSLVQRESALMQ